jgi:hypothetical protein
MILRLYAAIRLSPRDIEESPVPTLNTKMYDNKGLLVVITRDKVRKKET